MAVSLLYFAVSAPRSAALTNTEFLLPEIPPPPYLPEEVGATLLLLPAAPLADDGLCLLMTTGELAALPEEYAGA